MKLGIKNDVNIKTGRIEIKGNLFVPPGAVSIVIFSHGSGSGRFSPRNNFVASILNDESIATLLIDLLTPAEDEIYENRFNIDLLTDRLITATYYVHELPLLNNLNIGYFGASTGAASALQAAEIENELVNAVVSRGGRPDLASSLPLVKAPTLLIVGSLDEEVLELNKEAYSKLKCEKKLVVVEGATHLFEERGKLKEVANLATGWFKKYLLKHEPTL